MTVTYGLRLVEDNMDLVTFLNDGVRPEIDNDKFLIAQVNGPREITTKILTLEEWNAKIRESEPHEINELM